MPKRKGAEDNLPETDDVFRLAELLSRVPTEALVDLVGRSLMAGGSLTREEIRELCDLIRDLKR